ncbi:MAG: ABC transporter permease [Planctomycetota bacterium]
MIPRFLRSREARKLLRSKSAVLSLVVTAAYLMIALAVLLTGFVSLEDTERRVAPGNLRGFGTTPPPDARLDQASTYIQGVEKHLASTQRNPEDLDLGPLRLADLDDARFEATIEECWARLEAIDAFDELDSPEALAEIDRLETSVASLFAPLSASDQTRRAISLSFGTDRQGRSILMRALYSVKVAVQIGLVTAFISVLLGAVLGAAAGYFGSWVDWVVTWLYSTFSSVPNLVLLAVLAFAFTGSRLEQTLVPVYAAFCLTFWIGPCRVIRGEVLKLRELEYVQAATAVGFGRMYILLRHVLPNTAHLMFINFSLLFIGAVKSEVILSFLGLGVKKGPSWGIMISQSSQEVQNGFFWQIGTATAFMVGLVLAFNVLTDALQDAFDPKHV